MKSTIKIKLYSVSKKYDGKRQALSLYLIPTGVQIAIFCPKTTRIPALCTLSHKLLLLIINRNLESKLKLKLDSIS